MIQQTAPTTVDALKHYEKRIGTRPTVERKGAATPYTSVNGHTFSFLTKASRLALQLPEQAQDSCLKRYKTPLCEQHGPVLKAYVEGPGARLAKTQELKNYFDLSHEYVAALKPKATKKKTAS